MKKLLLILLCLPMIGFGQEKASDCLYVTDTVELVDVKIWIDGDNTNVWGDTEVYFKSLTTINKGEIFDTEENDLKVLGYDISLDDFIIMFDREGWAEWNEKDRSFYAAIIMADIKNRIGKKFVITYGIHKYKKDIGDDIWSGWRTKIGYYLFDIKELKQ